MNGSLGLTRILAQELKICPGLSAIACSVACRQALSHPIFCRGLGQAKVIDARGLQGLQLVLFHQSPLCIMYVRITKRGVHGNYITLELKRMKIECDSLTS